MAQTWDMSVQFAQSCQKAHQYPQNVLRTQSFEHSLEAYSNQLAQNEIFHSAKSKPLIAVWDLEKQGDGPCLFRVSGNLTYVFVDAEFQPLLEIKSDKTDQLKHLMNDHVSDPQCRMM